jgi:hypothetical protein
MAQAFGDAHVNERISGLRLPLAQGIWEEVHAICDDQMEFVE